MSFTYRILAAAALILAITPLAAAEAWRERPDWAAHFEAAGVGGTIVVLDERSDARWIHDGERAATRFLPASTFKIPHALFALDAGVVRGEFQVLAWDGEERPIASWNRDQDLRSSMRNSVVWVYEEIARAIGEERERAYLQKIDYGNADPSGGIERFWLDGALRISAIEQIAFLQRLYRNQLPFDVGHQRLVKDVIIVEAGRDWILRAKTGWQARIEPQVGWWVGWVERPDGAVFFALNIDMPNESADLAKRESIARAVLRSIGALPPEGAASALRNQPEGTRSAAPVALKCASRATMPPAMSSDRKRIACLARSRGAIPPRSINAPPMANLRLNERIPPAIPSTRLPSIRSAAVPMFWSCSPPMARCISLSSPKSLSHFMPRAPATSPPRIPRIKAAFLIGLSPLFLRVG